MVFFSAKTAAYVCEAQLDLGQYRQIPDTQLIVTKKDWLKVLIEEKKYNLAIVCIQYLIAQNPEKKILANAYRRIINIYARLYQPALCEAWFKEMIAEGIAPDTRTYNSLIYAYVKAKKPAYCETLFFEMIAAGLEPNLRSYRLLRLGWLNFGDNKNAKRWENRIYQNFGIGRGI